MSVCEPRASVHLFLNDIEEALGSLISAQIKNLLVNKLV